MASLFSAGLILAGCSTAWIGEAEEIVAVLIPATTNLVTLGVTLQGREVSVADLQTIQSASSQAEHDLQLMQLLITQYKSASASNQATLLTQIQGAVTSVRASLNGLLPALHIKDAATQAKITAVVSLLLSEVESVETIMPAESQSRPAGMMAVAARLAKEQTPLTASEFVVSYNATMTVKTGHSELDRAATGLRIHAHGKFARWASAGLLK